jgi:hypothetical protein
MSITPPKKENLNDEEWNEMIAIKNAIKHNITQVHPNKMETFTEYFVRSLKQRGG